MGEYENFIGDYKFELSIESYINYNVIGKIWVGQY